MLLGLDVDRQVMAYVKAKRDAGAKVNRKIVVACALSIVQAMPPSLLKEHGGFMDFLKDGRSWTDSFLSRANLVLRKATKSAKKLPEDLNANVNNFCRTLGRQSRSTTYHPSL